MITPFAWACALWRDACAARSYSNRSVAIIWQPIGCVKRARAGQPGQEIPVEQMSGGVASADAAGPGYRRRRRQRALAAWTAAAGFGLMAWGLGTEAPTRAEAQQNIEQQKDR
jgi:hypothetical protein